MEISTLAELVSTLGFPIVMCGLLFWKMNRQDELHREEVEKISESLENNTLAITRLVDKIGGEENE